MYNTYGKIRHTKIEVDGIKFDSKLESKYYLVLKDRLANKEIRDLELQKKYVLQDKFKKNNKSYREISYKADFTYFDIEENKVKVIDVKGWETPVFKLKKKMFEYRYLDYTLDLLTHNKTGWHTNGR